METRFVPRVRRTRSEIGRSRLLCVGVLLALPFSSAAPAAPYLVKDINPGTVPAAGRGPTQLTAVEERLYFTYEDSKHGLELWTSNGTLEETRLVADVCPGPSGSNPSWLTAAGSRLFFVAEGEAGKELWVSHGTPASALLVKDIYPGPGGSSPSSLTAAGSRVFFVADDGKSGKELWVSDGEAEGTRLLQDIRPGRESSDLSFLAVVGERLFFSVSGVELWASDGTLEGTRLVNDGFVQPNDPGVPIGRDVLAVAVVGEQVFFAANDDARGEELWVSDGTPAGTHIVKDISPGPESSRPRSLTVAREQLFFAANGQLWVSDGTETRTRFVKEFQAEFARFVAAGERVFFWDGGHSELWVTDGTTAGTRLVYSGTDNFDGDEIVSAGGYAYFSDDNSERLWVSDGTPAGTRLLSEDFDPHFAGATPLGEKLFLTSFVSGALAAASPDGVVILRLAGQPVPGGSYLVALGGRVFFFFGGSLAVSDGTPGGTMFVHILNGVPTEPLTRVGNRLFFTVSHELWVSDGEPGGAGTRLVKEMETPSPVPADSSPAVVATTAERVFFNATSESGRGLWVSDGNSDGTWLVHNDPASRAVTVGNHVFFSSTDALWVSGGTLETTWRVGEITSWIAVAGGRAFFGSTGGIWASDGTPAGTQLLRETPSVHSVVAAGHRVFFFAGTSPKELWVSNGTPEDTRLLMSTRSIWSVAVGDRLFFAAFSAHSVQLWVSEGTVDGTRLVMEFEDSEDCELYGRDCPGITPLVAAGEQLFFLFREGGRREIWVSNGTSGGRRIPVRTMDSPLAVNERVVFTSGGALWVTDGTSNGTVRLGGSSPSSLVVLGKQIFFADTDASHGRELWVTNGTTEGTRLFKEISPGPEGSNPARLRVQGEKLYFAASDGLSGEELWASDGTTEGTYRVADVRPGREGSMPGEFTAVTDRLFFAARDGVHGMELWAVDTERATRFLRGDCNGDRGVGIADAIFSLNRLFAGGRPSPCREACDANGDAGVDTSDAIFLLNHLFTSGPPPIDPGPNTCGTDPEPENSLGCESPSC